MLLFAVAFIMSCNRENSQTSPTKAEAASDGLDRTVLPIAEPKRQTYKELDARNAKALKK